VTQLEQNLDQDLAAGRGPRNIALFTPAQRRGESLTASSYIIGRLAKNAPLTPYLTFGAWESRVKRSNKALTVSTAKSTMIHLLDENAVELGDCTAFDCFGYETSISMQPYILSSGAWYEAVPTFVSRINRTVAQIPAPPFPLLSWDGVDDEGTYNLKCHQADKAFLHFDKTNVWYGGAQSRFEFCDLMHLKSRTLYFVKVPSRSSGMSHLVEQVRRSVELSASPKYR